MATFILLTKLSPTSIGNTQTRENIGRQWFELVKEKCPEVKWLNHYALLGSFDFLDIYEAPDEESAARVSLLTMSQGAVSAQSMPAIPYHRYLEIIKNV